MRIAVKFEESNQAFSPNFKDCQYITDGGYDRGYAEGHEVGLTEGEEVGYEKGYTSGREVGYAEGEQVGYERGSIEGTADAMQVFIDNRTTLNNLYHYAYDTQNVPKDALKWLEKVDLSNISEAKAMFKYCYRLADNDIPKFDIRGDVSEMFYYCTQITKVPSLDFSKCTRTVGLFYYCIALTEVPDLDFSESSDVQTAFYDCRSLISVGNIKLSKTKSIMMGNMFAGCTVLETVGEIDVRNVSSLFAFNKCKALKSVALKNIKLSLQIGSGDGSSSSHYGYNLTVECLTNLCYELRDTGSVKTLTVGSANLEKLASVYVRSIPITDEMRAADDLIDEKMPFEVCESTDEGATLIGDYVLLKNWKLA